MMVLLTCVLVLIGVIHALWGLEIWVPIRDEERLARAVVGAKDVTRMPGKIPCFLVVAGFCVMIAAVWTNHLILSRIILLGGCAIFLGRGVIAYTAFWRRMTPEQPFATYDQKYYAPLCLAIAAGIAIVLLRGL